MLRSPLLLTILYLRQHLHVAAPGRLTHAHSSSAAMVVPIDCGLSGLPAPLKD